MLRTIILAIALPVITLPLCLLILIISVFSPNARVLDGMVRFWSWVLVRLAGIRLTVEGSENMRGDQRYVVVANHKSWFDITCLVLAIPQRMRFMGKISLFKIPIFGWALSRLGFIPIDRKNRSTAVQSFDLAASRIRQGYSVLIFPEEGRSRTRDMRPFQRGAFLLAMKSELPILPVAVDGTYDVMRAGAWKVTPGPVFIRFGTPIETAGVSIRERQRLADEARDQILAMTGGPDAP